MSHLIDVKSNVEEHYKNTVRHILYECGMLKSGERLLILCDSSTSDLAQLFLEEAKKTTEVAKLHEIPLAKAHGIEPPRQASEKMLDSDLILSLAQFSLAHTEARINAGKLSARFLSLPCYNWAFLGDPALMVDYRKQSPMVRRISDLFTTGSYVHVQTKAGTDIRLNITGRVGNCCPGFVEKAGDLGSPPDIEANVSPLENESEGKAVIDGSITCPELGLLTTPVTLAVKEGRIASIDSDNKNYVRILEEIFGDADSKRRVLAECGVGLNPEASLTGSMLTDEGALGCMHFGFGSNYTVGGRNKTDFHLDFVFRDASLAIDDVVVIKNGELLI